MRYGDVQICRAFTKRANRMLTRHAFLSFSCNFLSQNLVEDECICLYAWVEWLERKLTSGEEGWSNLHGQEVMERQKQHGQIF